MSFCKYFPNHMATKMTGNTSVHGKYYQYHLMMLLIGIKLVNTQ